MRFWDTSALIPLMFEEAESGRMRQLLAEDGAIAISPITALEITSTLWRRRHAGLLRVEEHHDAEAMFAELSTRWNEVAQNSLVLKAALRVVTRHPLRTLDALQLAAAIVLGDVPAFLTVVTLDKDLANAARAEGFPVLP
jgi:predicted nucleic acid-binding protein